MRSIALTCVFILSTVSLYAAVQTKTVQYKQGDQALEGYLAWDDATAGPRPGVLVVHDWTGMGDYVKMRCRKLAELGYIAFGADIYGKGVRPASPQQAGAVAGKFKKDQKLMRDRVRAGLDVLRGDPLCDPKRIAAIGYCFGGTCVLELARSGADVAGVVSFHGGLSTANPADAKNIRGKVLVLHGGDDPHVSPKEVQAFQEEMRAAGVDWQFVAYGGAVHAFTVPSAGSDKSRGAAYNEAADRRSWEAMRAFFAEIFK